MRLIIDIRKLQTLLYMLLQRAGSGTLPPPGFTPPPWSSLLRTWDAIPQPASSSITLGPAIVSIGHNDPEVDDADPEKTLDVRDHEFGWDNEHPRRDVQVEEFRIEWRPVTNGQFYEFWKGEGRGKVQLPASWVEQDGNMKVRSGLFPSTSISVSISSRCMLGTRFVPYMDRFR
jgi:L-histidine Nalpha-methyltransferase / hercynylcysteine S-oxide synthase